MRLQSETKLGLLQILLSRNYIMSRYYWYYPLPSRLLIVLGIVNTTNATRCIEGEIRLANGPTKYEGRVEVCINRIWGTVCGRYSWDNSESNVVCKQLGHIGLGNRIIIWLWNVNILPYLGSVAYSSSYQYGQGTSPILMSNVNCYSSHSSLLDCNFNGLISSYCSHNYDAGVKCEGILVNNILYS